MTLDTPAENLALDEALLEECERLGGDEVLRFWESRSHFVVLGAGGVLEEEVQAEQCLSSGIPILRRCSGGGTVLQGPGCLNYALVLRRDRRGETATITGTNQFVLGRMAEALEPLCPGISHEGISDLAVGGNKISGTAQRRKRCYILFHGTLLWEFNLELLELYLQEPKRRPEYRSSRRHGDFVRNVAADPAQLRALILRQWPCEQIMQQEWPQDAVRHLVDAKYSKNSWNWTLDRGR